MFLRCSKRLKDGKEHLYWSVVENRRLLDGRIVQHHVLYLGELNGHQEASWRKSVDLFGQDENVPRQVTLFPDEHAPVQSADEALPIVRVRLAQMSLRRPRQWGACWLGSVLWQQLGLDVFWREHLPASRKGTRWDLVLQTLVLYRLIDPGSEWRLHRHWFDHSAVADLLGSDFRLAEQHHLYKCHDLLIDHKRALFDHLTQRLRDLFNAKYEVLLYDLTAPTLKVCRPRILPVCAASDTAGINVVTACSSSSPSSSRQTATLSYRLDQSKLREAWRREGRYLLRTNMTETDPAKLWEFYLQLTEVEQAFKELKSDLSIRPIHHQLDHRIDAHIFVSFLAYALQVTLKARLKRSANGLTPRSALEKFAAIQMLDVQLPTTDGREIILSHHTYPEKEMQLLLDQLKLTLPDQPPPEISVPKKT